MVAFLLAAAAVLSGPEARPRQEMAPATASTCFKSGTARGARIVAVGAYEGGLPTADTATHDGHVVKAVVVSAAKAGPPLVLVLTAYDPILWDLRQVPQGRLRAVYVTGYHAQSVLGAGRAVLRNNSDRKAAGACGDRIYAYQGGANLEALDRSTQTMFGFGIGRFLGAYTQRYVAIDGPPPRRPLSIALAGAAGRDRYKIGRQVDGPLGLARLLAAGAIRRATRADVARIDAILTAQSPTGRLAPVRAEIYLSEAYVLRRPINVPTGMYGGHSATFLVPRGMDWPSDPGSHNTYWSLHTAQCRGAGCNRGD